MSHFTHEKSTSRLHLPAAVAALAFLLQACGNSGAATSTGTGGATGGTGGGGTTTTTGGGGQGGSGGTGTGTGAGAGACDPDPLLTGLVAQQTGVSVDAFDCPVLKQTAAHGEPDAMLFKAIMYVESRFDNKAVACPNLPCGTPDGWTAAESGCFGLMQVVLACGSKPGDPGILPNGHPNLTTDTSSPDWPGSIFNPEVNIAIGIAGIAGNRAQVKQQFPGCTEDQYTLMAVGNYNSYGSTKSCTEYNKEYDDLVITAYKEYSKAASYPAHPY